MSNPQEPLKAPEKPEWTGWAMLKMGALFAACTAVVAAIFAKLPILRKLYNEGARAEAITAAKIGGVIGLAVGYAEGVKNHAEYPLKIENTQLKNEIAKLKPTESYAGAAVEEKLEKNSAEKTR